MDYEPMGLGGHVQNLNIPPIPADDDVQDAQEAGAVMEGETPPPLTPERILKARRQTSPLTAGDGNRLYEAIHAGNGALREEFATASAKLGGQIADANQATAVMGKLARQTEETVRKILPTFDAEFAKRDQAILTSQTDVQELGIRMAAKDDEDARLRVCMLQMAQKENVLIQDLATVNAAVEGNKLGIAALNDASAQQADVINRQTERLKEQEGWFAEHEDALGDHLDRLESQDRVLGDHGVTLNSQEETLKQLSDRDNQLSQAATSAFNLAYQADLTAIDALKGVGELRQDTRAQDALNGLAQVRATQTAAAQEAAEMEKRVAALADQAVDLRDQVHTQEEWLAAALMMILKGEERAEAARVVCVRSRSVQQVLADLFDKAQDAMDVWRSGSRKAGILASIAGVCVLVYAVGAFAFTGSPGKEKAPSQTAVVMAPVTPTAAASVPAGKRYACKELPSPPYQGDDTRYAGWLQLDCGADKVVLGDPKAKPADGDLWPVRFAGHPVLMKTGSPIPKS